MKPSEISQVEGGIVVRQTNSGNRPMARFTALVVALLGGLYPVCSSAQSDAGASGSAIISGAFQVASERGSLRGDPELSSGSLSFGIPSPGGSGIFSTDRLGAPGPFGHGTVLFPSATQSSVYTGSIIVAFSSGVSFYKNFGDKRTLTKTAKGFALFDPDEGTTFFGQKTSAGSYSISRVEGLDKSVPVVFSYASGASVPSSISLNGGEKKILIDQNSAGNITRVSFDGMVATYTYISQGGSNLLSEVKVDGTSVLKLRWEQGLPISAVDGYGQAEM